MGQALNEAGDGAQALNYFLLAADMGDAEAMAYAGYMYINAVGMDSPDYGQARACLERALEQDNTMAMYLMAHVCLQGLGMEPDVEKGLEWLEKAAEHGSRDAMSELGYMYAMGTGGVEADRRKAEYWLEKARESEE